MKKAILIITFTVLFLLFLVGCTEKSFSFKESTDDIESIELVSAESSLEFTVLKTLSDSEKEDFLAQFTSIEFHRYVGDPPRLRGDAIKITYKSGVYEMICAYTVEYVENGAMQFRWRKCDAADFQNLFNSFLE